MQVTLVSSQSRETVSPEVFDSLTNISRWKQEKPGPCGHTAKKVEDMFLALCCGGHRRLGEGSLIMQLQDEILQTICIAASQYLVSDSSWADFADINSAVEAVPDGSVVNITEGEYRIPRPLVLTGRITLRAVDGHGLAPLFASDVSPMAKRRPYALSDTTKLSLSKLQAEVEPSRSFAWSGGAQGAAISFGFGSADSLDGEHVQGSGSVIAVAETPPLGMDEPRRGVEGECHTECASEWERRGKGVVLRAQFEHNCPLLIVRGAKAQVKVQGLILKHCAGRHAMGRGVGVMQEAETIAQSSGVADASSSSSSDGIEGEEEREAGRELGRGKKGQNMCIKVQHGRLQMQNCCVNSQRGSGVLVRGSGQICLVDTMVGHCGHHGVTAINGGLVEAQGCEVLFNTLSGINAIGKGSCVRSVSCRVHGNEDGGFNVVQGALALTSYSSVTHNRGTGVRSMGRCSWAVKNFCVISGNGWHGASVVEGGQAIVDDCSVSHNGGAGVNAFAEGSATLSRCTIVSNRYGVWAQNHGIVRAQMTKVGRNEGGDEVALAGGIHIGT